MSDKHNKGRAAFRRGNFLEAELLAREAYEFAGNPHSKLNEMVAIHAQGKISKNNLDQAVYDLGLESGGHGQSVLKQGY